jgi:predicted  nucleic acid-binding Zn-ribbon protein
MLSMPLRFLALLSTLALLVSLAKAAIPGPDTDYQVAVSAFHKATATGSLEDRRVALDALVSLGEPAALGLLSGELGRVSTRLRESGDEVHRLRYAAERKRQFIDELRLRVEKDSSLGHSLKGQEEKLSELERKLDKQQQHVADYGPWHATLGEATAKFATELSSSKRKRVEKDVWNDIDDGQTFGDRLAAIEILGYIGGDGSAIALGKLIGSLTKERASLERKLPKLMKEVRKLEKRMQEENVKTGGRTSMGAQYARAKAEAAQMQRAIVRFGYLCDAASVAGGLALCHEEPATLEKSLRKLLSTQKKSRGGARRRILALLGSSGLEPVLAALRELLKVEKEAAGRAFLVQALAGAGDLNFVEWLLGASLADESWFVRSSAYQAAAEMRLKAAIPLLIERLDVEEGRLRTDAQEALSSLTAMNFRTSAILWRRWWDENEAEFEVPPLAEVFIKASLEARERVGTTFFGISTESRRVLFVLDLSGSMDFSMIPRNNPDDDPSRPYDEPKGKERSRLQEARTALNKAIGGTEDGAVFNIVFYASDVWAWEDDLVEMDSETRSEAQRMIEKLDAVGGTNIYGALAFALDMAGAEGGDEWSRPEIDTIFFLTDGRPSLGITTDPDEILGFVRDLNASAGIVIHTIGLSGAQDAYLLRSLAEQNGGKYSAL